MAPTLIALAPGIFLGASARQGAVERLRIVRG